VAHAYAKAFGARLHVFHVTWPDELGVTALFAGLVAELGTVVPIVVASQRGDAADEIVRYARDHGIQLIVLGTHGRTGVTRVLLGSVAERVLRTAPCPVLVVPELARTAASIASAVPSSSVTTLELPAESLGRCLVCSLRSPDLVCAPCRAKIRGEALVHKRQDER